MVTEGANMSEMIILRENGNERQISKAEFEELVKQPKVKLAEVEKGVYVKLEKMVG